MSTNAAGSHKHDLPAATRAAIAAIPKTVRSYGAKGDGTTDDTAALRAALATGVAIIPPGTYLTSPLLVPAGAVLQGVNGQAYYNATPAVPSLASLSRLRLKPGSTGPLLSPDDATTKATAVIVRDLALDGGGQDQSLIDLPDQASSISRFWRFERVYAANVGNARAVYVGNLNTACVMRDSVVFNGTSGASAGTDGVVWYGADGLLDNTFVGYFGGTGVTVMGGVSDITFTMRGGGSFTCTTGVVVGGRGAVFDGVSIDHNFNDGIYIGFGPTVLIGCTFHTNSRAGHNTWSNVTIGAPGVQLAMSGCRAAPRAGETTNDPKYMIDKRGNAPTIAEFGNFQTPGATFGTGWT